MQLSLTLLLSVAALCGLSSAYPTADIFQELARRDCSSEIAAFNLARREQRNVKRSAYPSFQNLTCILAPEALQGDYTANPLIRQDVTEGQSGIALTLDIGVLDVTTCTPLPNVMVEIWSANAQGNYGTSFLRGAFPSGSNGIAEFQTIFPGFTSEGANHINLRVHTSSSMSSGVAHVGQIFFTDKWTTIIGMQSPYNTNTHARVTDLDDTVYAAANKAGFYPVVDIESIHDDWPEGVLGYITVGVDPSKSRTVN
ncbi:dioxygenase [Lyophyllum atratum]|nr:dioxygenase [Lyophyllum atratum]